MDIKNIESKFWELKGKLMSGVIDQSTFEAEVKELKIRDGSGDWWRLNETNGKWTHFDGDSWVEGGMPEVPEIQPEAAVQSAVSESAEVQYHFEAPIDEDDFDFGIEADHLYGTLKELENVRLPDGFEEALASGKQRKYVKLEDATKKENIKKSWKRFFADKKDIEIHDDAIDMEPASSVDTGSSNLEMQPAVTGTKPPVPVEKLALGGLGTAAAAKMTSAATRKVKQKAASEIKDAVKKKRIDKQAGEQALPEAPMRDGGEPELRRCAHCGSVLKPGLKFCTSCGEKVAEEAVEARKLEMLAVEAGTCPACGFKNKENAKFCIKCGSKMMQK